MGGGPRVLRAERDGIDSGVLKLLDDIGQLVEGRRSGFHPGLREQVLVDDEPHGVRGGHDAVELILYGTELPEALIDGLHIQPFSVIQVQQGAAI